MEEKQEIIHLKQMITNWKDSYIRLAEENGNVNMYLLEDFIDEVNLYFPNYMERLIAIEYITKEELLEFKDFVFKEIEDLKKALGL